MTEQLKQINDKVNAFKYANDLFNSGLKDNWFTPQEFYENGGGDCLGHIHISIKGWGKWL